MKIGIDARIIFRRGVGRYISNLVKNLLEIDRENTYYIYLDKNSILKEYIEANNCKIKRLKTSNAFLYEQFFLPLLAAKDGIDILHSTDNTCPYLAGFFKNKIVLTIHDTMFVRPINRVILKPTLKQRFLDIYKKIGIPLSAKRADHIITVSEYSKQDIIRYLKVKEEKVTVIYEAVDKKYSVINDEKAKKNMKEKYKIIKPYILITAASDLRKNTARALEAFNIFNNITGYKYQLVITSIDYKELKTTNIIDKIKELNLEKYVIITGYVSDDDMVLLYNCAGVFLFPSIWEGFGLQVLESFASGCPVITSDNTSLKEIAKDAAIFVNPFMVDDIVRGLLEMEKNEEKKRELIQKGFERLKDFSWRETAKKTIEVYKKTIGQNNE
jgi:glycosyltransferase involved in cell wall biosynthesis